MSSIQLHHLLSKYTALFLTLVILSACSGDGSQSEKGDPTYTLSSDNEKKIEELIREMSLEEKVGQMTQLTYARFSKSWSERTGKTPLDTAALDSVIKKYHIGSWLGGFAYPAEKWAGIIDTLQRITLRHQPHKIPMLFGIDHVHGANYLNKGVAFPHNVTLGNSFNPELAKAMGRVTAEECHGLGHLWVFAPVLDVGRQKFWPRYYETFGEDPLVASKMGTGYTIGLQKAELPADVKVAACAKHFLGYSASTHGWDRSPIEMSDQTLQEFYRPPFQAAIDVGIKTVMINSGEINGEPVHASYKLLTELLREEMGFEGVAITDWADIISLYKGHKVAESRKEAVYLAIMAGVDMSMVPSDAGFCENLIELVKEGRISEDRINQSVRRILALKFDLGLMDNPYPTRTGMEEIGNDAHYEEALQASRESIVLMKNDEQTLPLDPASIDELVLCGPAANSRKALSGGWTQRWMCDEEWCDSIWPEYALTIYEGLAKEYGVDKITLADEGTVTRAARGADAIICAIGEPLPYAEGFGSIIDLDLDNDQKEMVQAALATGKPVILVLVEGRPRTIPNLYDPSSAVLFAGWPGYAGGQAIAEIISGKVNPSARMAFSYPYKQGHILPYNHKPSAISYLHGLKDKRIIWSVAEFGSGTSYTSYEYGELKLSDTSISKKGQIEASITISNTGQRKGKWPVLFFMSDQYASITRPIKELIHFEKVSLEPGESKEVKLIIQPEQHLSFPDETGRQILEEGSFKLMVGDKEKTFWIEKSDGQNS